MATKTKTTKAPADHPPEGAWPGDPTYQAALQSAEMNVLVMQLNVPSAKNTERFLGTMRRMGIDPEKIKIVVNRYVKKGWDIDPE